MLQVLEAKANKKPAGVNRRAVSAEPEPAPLVGRYRLSRLERAARRCRLRFLIDRRRRFLSSAWREAMANVMFNGILDSLTKGAAHCASLNVALQTQAQKNVVGTR